MIVTQKMIDDLTKCQERTTDIMNRISLSDDRAMDTSLELTISFMEELGYSENQITIIENEMI